MSFSVTLIVAKKPLHVYVHRKLVKKNRVIVLQAANVFHHNFFLYAFYSITHIIIIHIAHLQIKNLQQMNAKLKLKKKSSQYYYY